MRGRIQIQIVRHEALAATRHLLLLDHGMPTFDNFQIASPGCLRLDKLWPAIIPQRRNVRHRGQDVDFSQRQRGLPDSLRLRRNRCPKLREQPTLDLDNLFLRVEDLGLVLLQFRRGEALCPD